MILNKKPLENLEELQTSNENGQMFVIEKLDTILQNQNVLKIFAKFENFREMFENLSEISGFCKKKALIFHKTYNFWI